MTNTTNLHPTVAQNMAHRADIAWQKSTGRRFRVEDTTYSSEYLNPFTGQAIRKGLNMTGRDWFVFDAAGKIVARAHSLTWAKLEAERARCGEGGCTADMETDACPNDPTSCLDHCGEDH